MKNIKLIEYEYKNKIIPYQLYYQYKKIIQNKKKKEVIK